MGAGSLRLYSSCNHWVVSFVAVESCWQCTMVLSYILASVLGPHTFVSVWSAKGSVACYMPRIGCSGCVCQRGCDALKQVVANQSVACYCSHGLLLVSSVCQCLSSFSSVHCMYVGCGYMLWWCIGLTVALSVVQAATKPPSALLMSWHMQACWCNGARELLQLQLCHGHHTM